jgi:peroxiredoxin (alkyl hydroperoxide reductase subunit C)
MSVLVGKKAPHFSAGAVINGEEIVENFSLAEYAKDSYSIFFFYPKDFTKLAEFEAKGCKIVACSTDTEESHWGWLQMDKDNGGIAGVTYPIVADTAKTISTNYGVLAGDYDYNENNELIATGPMIAYRGLFLIDKEGVVRHQVVNDLPLGRSIDEAMRMLDSLIHLDTHGEVCPANWSEGKEAMTASFDGVADYLSKN